MHRKVESGVDFFLTQPIFDPRRAEAFIEAYQAVHDAIKVPILAGIMPLVTIRHARFLHNEVPGISIPDEIQTRMNEAGEQAAAEGAKIAIELVVKLRKLVQGIYLMPQFNRYDVVADIIEIIK